MGYWKSKVVPKIKKIFEKNAVNNKRSAAEATKSFDDSKDEINKQFEEKKSELQPKVVEIYNGLPAEMKALIKEPKEEEVKKNSTALVKFLEDLANIEFPGSKAVLEACSSSNSSSLLFFIFDKVSTLIVVDEGGASNNSDTAVEAGLLEREATADEEKDKAELQVAKGVDEETKTISECEGQAQGDHAASEPTHPNPSTSS